MKSSHIFTHSNGMVQRRKNNFAVIWIQFEMEEVFSAAIQSHELTKEMQKKMMNDKWVHSN